MSDLPDPTVEERLARLAPATFASRLYVHHFSDGTTRIAFGEAESGTIVFHIADRMRTSDARALRDLLDRTLPPA